MKKSLLPDCLTFSVSCTTRPPRQGECDGADYYFLSREQFLHKRTCGEFLESAEVHGNYYGTLRSEVEDRLGKGLSVLLDVDVQGARQVRREIVGTGLQNRTVFVFTAPPNMRLLEERLRQRATDAEETISKRIANSRQELEAWAEYDFLLVNGPVDQAVRDFLAIVDASLQRTSLWSRPPWEADA